MDTYLIHMFCGRERVARQYYGSKFNIINFLIYAFLIGKYVVPKLRTTFKETKEQVTAGLKASKQKMDLAQARLKESKQLLEGLNTKLSEIEINSKRDIEHFKERSARETKEKIEQLADELESRLATEKHNFYKRLNNEAAQNLVTLTKSKVQSDKMAAKQLNDLSIELLGNPL